MKKLSAKLVVAIYLVMIMLSVFTPLVAAADTEDIPISQFVADNHVLMTRADGRFIGWGDNSYGQLGLGNNAELSYSTPTEITFFESLPQIKQIAVIKDTSFVLLKNGALYSAGSGAYGKHGQGDTYNKFTWGRVGGNLTFKKLYSNAAAEYVLAEDFSGNLYAWGRNTDGQLGTGDTNARTSPTLIVEDAKVKSLWLGETYVEYVDLDGNLFYWGKNDKGQMGLSSAYLKTTHTQTAYSNGATVNKNSVTDLITLNPSLSLSPELFVLYSEEEVLNWATPEPPPPEAGAAAFTKLKYNIEPKRYSIPTSDTGYVSISSSSSVRDADGDYKHTFNVPQFLVNKYNNFPTRYLYMGTGNDAGKQFTAYNSGTMFYPFTERATYTCADWYTGKSLTVGPSTSETNYLFLDPYTGELVVDQSKAQTIYFFKISLPDQYNALPATEYSLGVSEETYNIIMNNPGASMEQEWCDYEWEHRTLFDKNKDIDVLAGANHSLAVIDNLVYGWGDTNKKQLGTAPQSTHPVPLTQINTLIANQKASGVNLKDIIVAGNSNYLSFDDGSIWVWGDNSYNKSGVSGAALNIDTPAKVSALQDKSIVSIVAGRNTNYYITNTGTIYVSGSNLGGVSGLGEKYAGEATIDTPTPLMDIGYSDTITPPPAPDLSVPEEVVEEQEIEVIWDIVPNASKYVLKRTVTLKSSDVSTAGIDNPETSSLLFVPKQKDFLSFLATTNSTPSTQQLVYDGNKTKFKEVAQSSWATVKYELKAVNAIGDYSPPVESRPVTVKSKNSTGGGSGTGGGGTGGGGSNITTPTTPSIGGDTNNITVNPPAITMPQIVIPPQTNSSQQGSQIVNDGITGGYSYPQQPFVFYQFFGSEYGQLAGLPSGQQEKVTLPPPEEKAATDTAVAASTVAAPNTTQAIINTIIIMLQIIIIAFVTIMFFVVKSYIRNVMTNISEYTDNTNSSDNTDHTGYNF